jgi:hypothetical protein
MKRYNDPSSNHREGESQRKVAGNRTAGTIYHVHIHSKNTLEILIA